MRTQYLLSEEKLLFSGDIELIPGPADRLQRFLFYLPMAVDSCARQAPIFLSCERLLGCL